MTAAHDHSFDQVTSTGVRTDDDAREDRVMTDEEFRAELAWQKQARKETERRLRDR